MTFHVCNEYRHRTGHYGSDDTYGNNGAFFIPNRARGPRGLSTREATAIPFKVIASDGLGWDHISVSLPTRCPTWEELCYLKDLHWDDEDCVVQFHPPRSEYVNNYEFCLHLWRWQGGQFPMPPSILVGFKVPT
jgi:hypothetical protein